MQHIGVIPFISGAFVVFVGYVIGYLLSLIAPEELIPGEKYFIGIEKILISLVVSGLVYIFYPKYLIAGAVLIIMMLGLWKINLPLWITIVFSAAAVLFSAFISIPVFMAFSGLAFLIGITDGTILVLETARKEKLFAKDKELHVILKKRMRIFGKMLILPLAVYVCAVVLFIVMTLI